MDQYNQKYYGTNQVIWKDGRKVYMSITSKDIANIMKIVTGEYVSPSDFSKIDSFAKSCKGITRELETVDPSGIEELVMHGLYQMATFLVMRYTHCDQKTAEDVIERMKSSVVIEGDVIYDNTKIF